MSDAFDGLVAGRRLETTISQFQCRAANILEAEQAKANPDNALIAFACDAIRLAREYCDVSGGIGFISNPQVDDSTKGCGLPSRRAHRYQND